MANQRKEFSKIYDQYLNKIYRFIFLKVSKEEVAQDLCSETFIKCWVSFQQEKIDNIQAFLYRIARNLVIDHYRDKGRTQVVSTENLSIIDPKPRIEENAALNSDIEQVKANLAGLKDDYQNVIIWHYLDDLPIPEVAKLLDRSEDATRVLLHRALEALREKVSSI
ncbi:MAG: RNA polymerase sigma factor [Candidatus Pacebacteria bacterium]|nr:RNA polymerase sigma factor [Candidatus Paceibacterota bacterium]